VQGIRKKEWTGGSESEDVLSCKTRRGEGSTCPEVEKVGEDKLKRIPTSLITFMHF